MQTDHGQRAKEEEQLNHGLMNLMSKGRASASSVRLGRRNGWVPEWGIPLT